MPFPAEISFKKNDLFGFFVSCRHQIDPSASCSVTSAQIEQCYNRNQRGVMEFYTAKYTYRLDFSSKAADSTQYRRRCIHVNVHFHFLLSDEADKCDNGEAAADQALPPLCHWLQVRSADANDAENL